MPSEYVDDLLHWAVIYIKASEFPQAERILQRVLDVAEDGETRTKASYLMSTVCSDPAKKRGYLEDTLASDPTHPEARRALAILDGKLKQSDIVNPDALPAQAGGSQQTTADRFTCPKCGARMVFDGDGKTLYCEHCTRGQAISSATPEFEQDFILAMATGKGHRTPIKKRIFNCQGCGASFSLPAQQISSVCAYCGSPHVVALDKDLIEPDSIIPMGLNKEQAARILIGWMQKHHFPEGTHVKEPKGLYLSVWTFDMLGTIPWNGTVYRNKQRVPVSGEESVNFEDITVPGDGRLADLMPKLLVGLKTSDAPAYDERYLAGWPAEVNEQSMSDASLDARQQVAGRVKSSIINERGFIEDLSYSTANLSVLSFRLVLVPIWYSLYRFEDHDYRVVISGQSGKIYGEVKRQGILGWLEEAIGL